jgi:hypothetical protein
VAGLSVPLEPRDVFIETLRNRVQDAPHLAAILPRQIGKPLAGCLLPLGEAKHVLAVGLGYVIGSANRLKAPTVLAAVVSCDPGAAFGAPAVADRQPL